MPLIPRPNPIHHQKQPQRNPHHQQHHGPILRQTKHPLIPFELIHNLAAHVRSCRFSSFDFRVSNFPFPHFPTQTPAFAPTNSIFTPGKNPLIHSAHHSIPACSDGICPISINAFFFPSVTASATYSNVSHSRDSPANNTSISSRSSAFVSRVNPVYPGFNPIFVTLIFGSPTTRTAGASSFFAT